MKLIAFFLLLNVGAVGQKLSLNGTPLMFGRDTLGVANAINFANPSTKNLVNETAFVWGWNNPKQQTWKLRYPLRYNDVDSSIYIDSAFLATLDTATIRALTVSTPAPLYIKGDQGIQGVPGPQGIPGTAGESILPMMSKTQILATRPEKPVQRLGTDGKLYVYDVTIKRWRAFTGTPQ